MIRRLCRYIACLHHRACIRDMEHAIEHHQRQLANLPAEIARLEQVRKFHVGRASTLTEARSAVNWNLGR